MRENQDIPGRKEQNRWNHPTELNDLEDEGDDRMQLLEPNKLKNSSSKSFSLKRVKSRPVNWITNKSARQRSIFSTPINVVMQRKKSRGKKFVKNLLCSDCAVIEAIHQPRKKLNLDITAVRRLPRTKNTQTGVIGHGKDARLAFFPKENPLADENEHHKIDSKAKQELQTSKECNVLNSDNIEETKENGKELSNRSSSSSQPTEMSPSSSDLEHIYHPYYNESFTDEEHDCDSNKLDQETLHERKSSELREKMKSNSVKSDTSTHKTHSGERLFDQRHKFSVIPKKLNGKLKNLINRRFQWKFPPRKTFFWQFRKKVSKLIGRQESNKKKETEKANRGDVRGSPKTAKKEIETPEKLEMPTGEGSSNKNVENSVNATHQESNLVENSITGKTLMTITEGKEESTSTNSDSQRMRRWNIGNSVRTRSKSTSFESTEDVSQKGSFKGSEVFPSSFELDESPHSSSIFSNGSLSSSMRHLLSPSSRSIRSRSNSLSHSFNSSTAKNPK